MLLELGASMDFLYLTSLVIDNTGKLRLGEDIHDLVFWSYLGAHVYDLPFEMDDPKVPDGWGKYTTKRERIEGYEKWVEKQMNRLTAELEAKLKGDEHEKVS
jgi:hypothetical protein